MSVSSKKSKLGVDAAREKWAANLKSTTKRRPNLPELKNDLINLNRMPLTKDIAGRYLGLYDELKGRQERIKKVSEELINLWHKLNFPVVSPQQVKSKVEKIIKFYDASIRRPKANDETFFNNIFDITKKNGV